MSIQRDNEIVRLYSEGLTLRRIGLRFGITHERVRQILTAYEVSIRGRGYRSPDPVVSRQRKAA